MSLYDHTGRLVKRPFWTRDSRPAAVILLLLSFAVGCTQLYWNNFIDEGDNIAVGDMLARGYVLYRDVFSHHFPFPYYWVALVVSCCGNSIFAVRLSVLLLQTLAFGVAVWLTPFRVALAIAALVWRCIGYPYYGNLVIYPAFNGTAFVPVFAMAFAAATRQTPIRRQHVIWVGVFASVAILSDPLAIYPVALSVIVMSVAAGWKKAAAAAAIVAALLSVWLVTLLATGALGAFVADAIRFNHEVYSKYTRVDPLPYQPIVHAAWTLLALFDARWAHLPSLVTRYTQPDRSPLTGFFFRAAIIIGTMLLLGRRKWLAAVYLYLTAAILIGAMGEERFRAIPFILVALFASAWCCTEQWQRPPAAGLPEQRRWQPSRLALPYFTRGVVGLALLCLLLLGLDGIVENRAYLSYTANFQGYEQRAAMLRRLACDRPDVALIDYPSDPLMHFFTRMRPASPYIFMLPWVAEVALPEVIQRLASTPTLVQIDPDGAIWGRRNSLYMASLIEFVSTHYVVVGRGLYRSPELNVACPIAR